VAQIEGWPEAIAKVTLDDVRSVARTYLDPRRSVTGYLVPEAAGEDDVRAETPAPGPASSQMLR